MAVLYIDNDVHDNLRIIAGIDRKSMREIGSSVLKEYVDKRMREIWPVRVLEITSVELSEDTAASTT